MILRRVALWRVLWIATCAGLLAGFPAGCRKEEEPGKAERDEQVGLWKSKYESLVRRSEEVYQEIETLEQQNADRQARLDALQQEFEERAADQQARKEVEELTRRIADAEREETIEKLLLRVKELRAELAEDTEETGAESPRAQLAALRERTLQVRQGLEETGRALFDAGLYGAALWVFSSSVELGSQGPEVHFRIAYCYGELGDEEAAAAQYARAIEVAEEHPEQSAALLPKLYNNYGATLVALGKPGDALTWYGKAIEASQDYAPAHFNLGRLYAEHLKEPSKAIEAYRRHVALGGSRSMAARDAIQRLQQEPQEGE